MVTASVPEHAPAFLTLHHLAETEEVTRSRLISQLRVAQHANARQQAYYEGSRRIRDLGIAIPPHLRDVEAVAGWPEIVVDVIDERSDWRGWVVADNDPLGLGQVFKDNHLGIEVGQAVLDALICGLGYLSTGTGDVDRGEPDVLVKAESPSQMTATWSPRLRRAEDALRENYTRAGTPLGWTIYDLDSTVTVERSGGRLVVTDRDEHNAGRVPVSVLLNRPRSSRLTGRSEITRAVRSLTDSGMRTLLGMEISREFYAAPQRYLMGADMSMFVDEDGNPTKAWDVMIGRLLLAPRDAQGELPIPGEFQAASPQPFTEILKTLAQAVSAATGLPATHLGFATDNPSSADAIRQANGRLDRRAGRRHRQYDLGLVDLGETVCLWRDGRLPERGSVASLWESTSEASPGAAADRAVKMIAAGVLDPTWDFTLEQFGLRDDEIRRVKAERDASTPLVLPPAA